MLSNFVIFKYISRYVRKIINKLQYAKDKHNKSLILLIHKIQHAYDHWVHLHTFFSWINTVYNSIINYLHCQFRNIGKRFVFISLFHKF
jgi:hypothetical protein